MEMVRLQVILSGEMKIEMEMGMGFAGNGVFGDEEEDGFVAFAGDVFVGMKKKMGCSLIKCES